MKKSPSFEQSNTFSKNKLGFSYVSFKRHELPFLSDKRVVAMVCLRRKRFQYNNK